VDIINGSLGDARTEQSQTTLHSKRVMGHSKVNSYYNSSAWEH